jgi:hypothetical protein
MTLIMLAGIVIARKPLMETPLAYGCYMVIVISLLLDGVLLRFAHAP